MMSNYGYKKKSVPVIFEQPCTLLTLLPIVIFSDGRDGLQLCRVARNIMKVGRKISLSILILSYIFSFGDRSGTVVKALRYKSEGRWFNPRWCLLEFFIDIILPIELWPWG